MGTFVGIVGKTEVPKEHLETYVKQMLTVWKYGGMMQYETVRLYGKNIIQRKNTDRETSAIFFDLF